MASTHWTPLGAIAPTELADARIQLHWAAQVLAAAADALLPRADDDSHTNVFWSEEHGAVIGRPLPGDRRLGVAVADFALLALTGDTVSARQPLAGETLESALAWARSALEAEPQFNLRDYDMPEHPVRASGARFSADVAHLVEIGRYFAASAAVLGALAQADERATSIAIWPHHFDLGGILFLDSSASAHTAAQIGFGLSPGDGNIAEPYFYITPWPLPDNPEWPQLDGGGYWHTEGFNGALLLASRLVQAAPDEQRAQVESYVQSAIRAGEALIRMATDK